MDSLYSPSNYNPLVEKLLEDLSESLDLIECRMDYTDETYENFCEDLRGRIYHLNKLKKEKQA